MGAYKAENMSPQKPEGTFDWAYLLLKTLIY